MNIFVSSPCPYESASYLDDKRVVKMILESAQMLNVALIKLFNTDGIGYKLTHVNHPCTKWACANQNNYAWLFNHFVALCSEYTRRYGKIHKCQADYMHEFSRHVPSNYTPVVDFVNCTTHHKHIADVHEAYKAELELKWRNDIRVPTWNKRRRLYMPYIYNPNA